MNSMILHDGFFDGLGEESEPGSVLARWQKLSVYVSVTEICWGRPDWQRDACRRAWRAARGRGCEPRR
jgi:hypothetical protein